MYPLQLPKTSKRLREGIQSATRRLAAKICRVSPNLIGRRPVTPTCTHTSIVYRGGTRCDTLCPLVLHVPGWWPMALVAKQAIEYIVHLAIMSYLAIPGGGFAKIALLVYAKFLKQKYLLQSYVRPDLAPLNRALCLFLH